MRSEIGKGVTWMVLLRAGDRMLGIVSMLVLARLLTPEDFGLVAMAMSVIAVIELATALGFDVPLINKESPNRVEFDTAWTLTIIVYLSCALVIALLAVPMAHFFGEPRLTLALWVIVGGWMLNGLENVGTVEFRRQMKFSKEFVFRGLKRLIGFLVTIISAIIFRSYWALIAGMVAGSVAGVVLSYVLAPYRPRFALGAARELFSYSKWLLSNNAVLVGIVRFPHFLIGRLLGAQSLGVYTLAYDIATMPATELSAPVNRAAYPGYARLVSEPEAFKKTFMDIGALVVAIALPAGVGLALVAEELVLVALGQQWAAAAPLMEILAISAVFVAATGNNGIAHLALGYAKAVTVQSALRLIVLVLLSVALIDEWGVQGIALAELCGAVACFVASFPLIFRRLEIRISEYLSYNWRPVFASLVMSVAVLGVKTAVDETDSFGGSAFVVATAVPTGVLVYSASLYVLWRLSKRPEGAERVLLNKLNGAGISMRRSCV
ncbi:lipopolysaccharide biosynthesis protein [Lentisalinibacter salinarum]|uniref:lipopolysaccharide biosynthesis protein n=1 Tax=Lentisalinibacter salinarum TaxID=2992239 RepID=UPI0038643DAA